MYAKVVSGVVERFPYSQADLEQDNPNTSFPQGMTDDQREPYNMYRVRPLIAPTYEPATEDLVKNETPELVNGEWILGWTRRAKTPEEIAYYRTDNAIQARLLRDKLLLESDWVVVLSYEKGTSVPTDWVDYRQALRDITGQEGFPLSITWPTRPSTV